MRRDETRGEKKDLRPPAGEQYGVRLKLCAGCMGVVTWSPLRGGLAGADRVAPHLAIGESSVILLTPPRRRYWNAY